MRPAQSECGAVVPRAAASTRTRRRARARPSEPRRAAPAQVLSLLTMSSALSTASRGKGHVLVTGGAGYIGSHTCVQLLDAGYDVTVLDNLVNSKVESLRRVGELTGKADRLAFREVDLRDAAALKAVVAALPACDACIHFAGLKAVGESTKLPLEYYENNVGGTLALLSAMRAAGIKNIVFSSSATVYGAAESPITEATPTGAGITNAYGRSKYVIEEILGDFSRSPEGADWSIAVLRYFNPVGAHPSGRIGEDPSGPPNNLMPYVSQVAVRAAQESEIPNFKGSYLGRFPLVSADFWTSDHLSERSRSVDAFPGTRARGTLTLKRR